MQTRSTCTMMSCVLALAMMAGPALANETTPEWMTPHKWPQPGTIVVYTDSLPSPELEYVMIGIQQVTGAVDGVEVEFRDGNRPAGAGGVQLSVEAPSAAGVYGEGGLVISDPLRQGHIKIHPDVFNDKSGLYGEYDQESGCYGPLDPGRDDFWAIYQAYITHLAVHEMLHVMGLDHPSPASSDPPTCVMDDTFSPAHVAVYDENGRFVRYTLDTSRVFSDLTQWDRDALSQHYTMVPEPAASGLLAMAAVAVLRRRRSGKAGAKH